MMALLSLRDYDIAAPFESTIDDDNSMPLYSWRLASKLIISALFMAILLSRVTLFYAHVTLLSARRHEY